VQGDDRRSRGARASDKAQEKWLVAGDGGRRVEDIRDRDVSDGPTTEKGREEDKRTRSKPSKVYGKGEGRNRRWQKDERK
jgi:hypothetical protein